MLQEVIAGHSAFINLWLQQSEVKDEQDCAPLSECLLYSSAPGPPAHPEWESGQRWESAISTVNEVSSHTPDLFIQLSPARYVLHSYIMQHDYVIAPGRRGQRAIGFYLLLFFIDRHLFLTGLCELDVAWLKFSCSAVTCCNRKDIAIHRFVQYKCLKKWWWTLEF